MSIPSGEWVIISEFSLKFRIGKSLRVRIFVLCILIGIIPVLLVSEILKAANREAARSGKMDMIRTQSQIVSNQLSAQSYSTKEMPANIAGELEQLAIAADGRVVLTDINCKVINDTFSRDTNKVIISSGILTCLKDKKNQYSDNGNNQYEFVYPIREAEGDNIKGTLVVLVSTEIEMRNISRIENIIILFEIVGCLLIIVIGFFMSKLLVRPFAKLSESIIDISEGYSGEEDITFQGYTEMQQLSEAINTMVAKMQSVDNSRQEFVSNVSHELKTPITSMKVLADSLLVQEDVPVELYKEFMLDIADEIERENKIINDLLSLVKMDKASADLNIAPITINEMLELILKRLRPIAATRDIELVFESFRPITAEVDEVKLTLAFSNLIENAIKYNVDGGWVHVSLNADHKYFYVKVSDSGIGIPEESLDNIYERFYRVDKSHSREIGGTGLGLAITKSAILKHRGSIKVYSKEEEGTTFTVRIPLIYAL